MPYFSSGIIFAFKGGFFFLSCLGQTNTRLNKVKQVLELGNGGHRAEASVSAVPMFAFCLTP